jgi:hypothetical protein
MERNLSFDRWWILGQVPAQPCLLVAKYGHHPGRASQLKVLTADSFVRGRMHLRHGDALFCKDWEAVPPAFLRHNHRAADGGGNVLRAG